MLKHETQDTLKITRMHSSALRCVRSHSTSTVYWIWPLRISI